MHSAELGTSPMRCMGTLLQRLINDSVYVCVSVFLRVQVAQ